MTQASLSIVNREIKIVWHLISAAKGGNGCWGTAEGGKDCLSIGRLDVHTKSSFRGEAGVRRRDLPKICTSVHSVCAAGLVHLGTDETRAKL